MGYERRTPVVGALFGPRRGFITSPELSRFNTQYSLKQLQSMARDHNISPAGLKEDLIRRLVEKGILS